MYFHDNITNSECITPSRVLQEQGRHRPSLGFLAPFCMPHQQGCTPSKRNKKLFLPTLLKQQFSECMFVLKLLLFVLCRVGLIETRQGSELPVREKYVTVITFILYHLWPRTKDRVTLWRCLLWCLCLYLQLLRYLGETIHLFI